MDHRGRRSAVFSKRRRPKGGPLTGLGPQTPTFNNHNPRSCTLGSCNAKGSTHPSGWSRRRTRDGNSTLPLRGNRSRPCIRASKFRPTRARWSASIPSRPGNHSGRAQPPISARLAPCRSSCNSRPPKACSKWVRRVRSIGPWKCTRRLPNTERRCSGRSPPRRRRRGGPSTHRPRRRPRERRPARHRTRPSPPTACRPVRRTAPRERGARTRRGRGRLPRGEAMTIATSPQGVRRRLHCQGRAPARSPTLVPSLRMGHSPHGHRSPDVPRLPHPKNAKISSTPSTVAPMESDLPFPSTPASRSLATSPRSKKVPCVWQ